MEPSLSPHLPRPPKESLDHRYKPIWRLLLISNLTLGAYIFARSGKKDRQIEDETVAAKVPSAPSANSIAPAPVTPTMSPPITDPLKVRQPIPEDQQHVLFKWILEEKRKVKPMNPEEEKKINEERAILGQFIEAKSFPSF